MRSRSQACDDVGTDVVRDREDPCPEVTVGRGYREGAVTIGLCIHGDSVMNGHGPGILTLMTCATANIQWEITPDANIAQYMKIGIHA